MRAIAVQVPHVSWSVSVSYLCVGWTDRDIPVAILSRFGPRSHVLDGVQDPPPDGRSNFWENFGVFPHAVDQRCRLADRWPMSGVTLHSPPWRIHPIRCSLVSNDIGQSCFLSLPTITTPNITSWLGLLPLLLLSWHVISHVALMLRAWRPSVRL